MVKLSIVIPVYNVENYLAKCLDSVIYPDIKDYEIIVVNDGSTDSSAEIAAKYEKEYPNLVKLVHKENGGLGSARNSGLAAAAGEYVQFLDSDDYLIENAVPEIIESLNSGYDIGIFDTVSINEFGRELIYNKGCERSGSFRFSEYPELLFQTCSACNKIYRRSLFTETGILFPGRLWFEDLATIPKLYLHSGKIQYLPRPWYRYLMRSDSITNNKNIARNSEMLRACDSVLDYYKEKGLYEKYRLQLEYMICYNEFITSTTRVNLADLKSPVQDELLDYFLLKVPKYASNPYISAMPKKLRLLMNLALKKKRREINLIMNANNILKRKKH